MDNLGQMSYVLGNKKEALDYYLKALDVGRASGSKEAEGIALSFLGKYYVSESPLEKGLNYIKQAMPLLIESKNNASEELDIVFTLHQLAGEDTKALDYFNEILTLAKSAQNEVSEGNILRLIGMLHWYLNDEPRALDYYLQSLRLLQKVDDRRAVQMTLNNIALAYTQLGEFDRARTYLGEALTMSRSNNDRPNEAVTLINLGRLDLAAGSDMSARGKFSSAAEIARTLNDGKTEAMAVGNVCTTYNLPEEKEQRFKCYLDSLKRLQDLKEDSWIVSILFNLAFHYKDRGQKQQAFDSYTQALSLSTKLNDQQSTINILNSLALFELDRGNLQQARVDAESAIQILESSRGRIGSSELQGYYFGTRAYVYKTYIHILMESHRQQPAAGYDLRALQASERGRARSLVEKLREAGGSTRQPVDKQLLEREQSLEAQLNAKAFRRIELLAMKDTELEAKALALEIEVLMAELENVRGQIRQKSPRNFIEPTNLTVQQIQALLDQDTVILEYSLGEEASYLWAITSTSITSHVLPKASEVTTAALELYDMLARRNPVSSEMLSSARNLSQMLLAPIAPQLQKKRVVVVGDGALQSLPFATLPNPTAARRQSGYVPLILTNEFINLPSIATLVALRTQTGSRKPAPGDVAVIADPVFSAQDQRVLKRSQASVVAPTNILSQLMQRVVEKTSAERDGDNLARLPGSRREAEAIAALLPSGKVRKILDFNSSRDLVKREELAGYRNLLFATHALIDNTHPELTAIVLSLVDQNGNPTDGYLRLHEIQNLNLSADLVVLSACSTGLGKDVEGEGLIGLTQGFIYAGAARVVVSLWKVDDDATAELMIKFYKGMLKEGKRPAEALRAAQVEMLKSDQWKSPHYWAAFVLQGEWR
jgi:CHAT domain-containing protein